MKKSINIGAYLLICGIVIATIAGKTELATASESKSEQFKVSEGVNYYLSEKKSSNNNVTSIRVMEINMADPYTKIELGYPTVLNRLERMTTQTRGYDQKNGYSVIGAINGSFNHLAQPLPIYLISNQDQLVFSGEISSSKSSYVNEPIAFGMGVDGKGMIDYYNLQLNYTYNGETYPLTSTNKPRTPDSAIIYTSDFYHTDTDTNKFGREIVVETTSVSALEFGSAHTGTVKSIRSYGDKTKSKIPKNGFVISANGKKQSVLEKVNIGDTISFSIDIDEKWRHASFMLGSGPLLVKDGKVSLSMDPTSFRATQKAPRTAVGVDKSGEKVLFVTVDGRQKGYTNGMSMIELANQLVHMGADRALNLDGGGSTTMAVRHPGNSGIEIVNSPSDGRERGVSTILMAMSSEPKSMYTDVSVENSHFNGVEWLTKKGIQGFSDGTFGVQTNLNRSHAAIMFSKSMNLDLPAKDEVIHYFDDVKVTHDYAKYIAAVGKRGIFKGSQGRFLPSSSLTREQMATAIVKAFDFEYSGKDVPITLTNVDQSHKENVQILANLGITNQTSDFRPKRAVTRGQFATFLYLAWKQSDL